MIRGGYIKKWFMLGNDKRQRELGKESSLQILPRRNKVSFSTWLMNTPIEGSAILRPHLF